MSGNNLDDQLRELIADVLEILARIGTRSRRMNCREWSIWSPCGRSSRRTRRPSPGVTT